MMNGPDSKDPLQRFLAKLGGGSPLIIKRRRLWGCGGLAAELEVKVVLWAGMKQCETAAGVFTCVVSDLVDLFFQLQLKYL